MKFLKISNIKLNIDSSKDDAFEKALKISGLKENSLLDKKILKLSIDARKKDEIHKIYTVGLLVKEYSKNRKNVTVMDEEPHYSFNAAGTKKLKQSPVVVGFGPAGMFCAYMLAKYGYNPIIIERGSKVEERINKINKFWNEGVLDTECNVQFGEGGAGTFSDGKLNTGIKDKENRIKFVLDTFVKFGAKENILYDAKPHIGTDVLSNVIVNMRKAIEDMGGTFLFDTAVTDLIIESDKLTAVKLNNGDVVNTQICILAIGHSARDTFEMLNKKGIPMEQKPFAIGVRIEHNQSTINKNQYGFEDDRLGAADYKLTYKTSKNRGVYSFCMCPGGYVVNSSSEKDKLVVNGMSYNDRAGKNANSAMVVTITPDDFPSNDVLAGIELQRELETKAYKFGNGLIPVQKFMDFKENKVSDSFENIMPQTKGNTHFANINEILPKYICEALVEGVEHFGTIIKGFNNPDVVLSAVESRTSSPVRILRNDDLQSDISGLYPAGEGAGYAGGITSAAIDGMKIFEKIANKYYA